VPKGDRDLSVPAVPQARPGFTLAAIFATSHGGGDGVKGRASDERSELASMPPPPPWRPHSTANARGLPSIAPVGDSALSVLHRDSLRIASKRA
jgi:hypothetical protein